MSDIAAMLACPCCGKNGADIELVFRLAALLKETGPLTIHSGFRCEKENRGMGGQRLNRHCEGVAVNLEGSEALYRQIRMSGYFPRVDWYRRRKIIHCGLR